MGMIFASIRWACLILFLGFCQIFVVSHWSWWGFTPSLLLLCVIAVSVLRDWEVALPVTIACFALQQMFLGEDLYFVSWLLLPACMFFLSRKGMEFGFWGNLLLKGSLCALLAELVNLLVFSLQRQDFLWVPGWHILLATVLSSLLLLPIAALILRLCALLPRAQSGRNNRYGGA